MKVDKLRGALEALKVNLKSLLVEFEQVSTDKGILSFDEDELAEGIEVFVLAEDGTKNKPEDGDYSTETQVITVKDGKIETIADIEKPVEDENTDSASTESASTEVSAELAASDARETKFSKIKAIFSESYDEKYRKIYDAIYAKGVDGYIMEAGDDYCVLCIWVDDENYSTEKYFKYDVTWNEDGTANIEGNGVEVVRKYVPVEDANTDSASTEDSATTEDNSTEDSATTETQMSSDKVTELQKKITELESQIAEFEKNSKPIFEEFEAEKEEVNLSGASRKERNIMKYL